MIIWLALIIPIVVAIILEISDYKKITIPELIVLFAIPLALVVTIRYSSEHIQTVATEFLGGYSRGAQYYEDWDEEVPCRHPIYCTGSCGKDCTYTYVCGYEHPYDVDYHPPYWEIVDSNDARFPISQSFFLELTKRWNNQHFVDMHRVYHSKNGNMYETDWDKKFASLEATTVSHTYENRVQASNSIFSFKKITPQQAKTEGLYMTRPTIDNYYWQAAIMGEGGPTTAPGNRNLSLVNGFLGKKSKGRFYVLIFKNKSMDIASDQQAFWKNGQQNEMIICIGVNNQNQPQWCFPFGWSKLEGMKADIRDFIMKQKTLDLMALSSYLYDQMFSHVILRDFREFKYLVVDPPMWLVILTFALVLLICIGLGYWDLYHEHTWQREYW